MGKNKEIQFNLTSRQVISQGLKDKLTAKQIGLLTNHHGCSVSREVRLHRRVFQTAYGNGSICSTCSKKTHCKKGKLCGSMMCTGDCKYCKNATSCSTYIKMKCDIENRWPFVCDKNCSHFRTCCLTKYEYIPEKANQEALTVRTQSRAGIDMSENEFKRLDSIIYNKTKNGQSIHHICKSNNINRSKSSIYAYIHAGYLKTKPIDLPKAVTYKVRKKLPKQYEYLENKNYDRANHLYYDWIIYRNKHRTVIYWEMDFLGCVRDSEEEILTLACPSLEFLLMFVFKRPNSKEDVVKIFDELEEKLGLDLFSRIFEVILTDRDSRFNIIDELEFNNDGVKRSNLFYCNSGESNQKPLVENENSQIRSIFPKGEIIKDLTQDRVNVITSNFNSRILASLGDHCASEAFIDVFGIEAFNKLHLKIINPSELSIKKYSKY